MDKLKKVFSPGSSKDDEVLYGDGEARSASASKQPEREPETLHATEDSQKKEHSILRQIMNPGGDKYDDQRFGTTATTEAPDSNKLQTDPGQKDHSVMRQLVNPAGDKYDEQAYGTTAATAGDRKSSVPTTESASIDPNEKLETDKGQKEHGILRQILNPHGKKYDEEGYGKTAHAAEDDSGKPLPLMRPGQNLVGDKEAESSSRTEPSQSQAGQSNLGRDTAIAGGAAAVAGGGAYAATRGKNEPEQSNTTSGGTSSLQDKVGRDVGYDQSTQSASTTAPAESQTASQPAAYTALTRDDPSTTQSGDNSHLGRDAAIAGGVGAVGAGGAYAATRDRDHKTEPSSAAVPESERMTGRGDAIAGTDPSTVGSGFLGSGTHGQHSSSTAGPSSTLDAKPQTEGLADGRSAETAANEQSGQHNYGRDATLASGVAAGGALAAHESSKDRNQQGAQGDSFIAATGTAPISRPLDGDNDLTTGRTTESTGTSNLPNESSKLESGYAGHLGSSGTPAGSGFTEQSGSAATGGAIGGLESSSAPGHGHINPVGAPEAALAGSHHHGVIGSGVHHDTGSEQLNQAPADVQAATYTYSSQQLAGSSKPFTPHVPGEFPTETGEDPHEASRAYGSSAGTTGGLTSTTSDRKDHTTATSGTAAGLATGAAVGGGLVAGDSSNRNIQPQQSSTIPTETSTSSTQEYPLRSKTNQMDTPITPAVEPEQPKSGGRDAAIAGGAVGAGALAAGAAAEATKKNDAAVPSTASPTPDAALASKTADTPLAQPTTTPAAPVAPITEPTARAPLQKDEPKLGKDAAVAGGAGAAGATALDAKDTGPAPKTIGPHDSDVKNVLDPRVQPDPAVQGSKKEEPAAAAAAPKATEEKSHDTRDAAVAAGAVGAAGGAAAAAGTSHDAYGEEDPNKHNKLHKPTPEEKKHDKELDKEQKKHDKAAEKEHKKAEKAAEKEHQKAEKQAEKDHKKAEKAAEKEYKKSEKEAEKTKKASFIDKILHRNDDKEVEHVQNDKTGEKRGDLNHPLAGAAEAEQAERQAQGLPAKDPATQPSAGLDGTSEGVVIEPHSGLPMNVGKYGAGSGGTDGATQIEGYHEGGHAEAGHEGVSGPDWDAIKKANTPY